MSSTSKATTLFNLKDEYLKAKSDTNKSAAQGSNNHKKLKDIIHYKKAEKEKRLVEKNAKQRKRAERLALSEKEEQDLANSRSILEAKSAVYDKLLQRDGGESSDNILVDFSQKRIDGHEIPFDYKPKPSYSDEHSVPVDEAEAEYDEVHLSHVDKGEIRSKGVGFYSFSKDSEIRKQQMEFLNSMRESTERSREIFLATKKKRKQEKLDRLNRLRKRLDMAPLTVLPNEKSVDDDEINSNEVENVPNSDPNASANSQDQSSINPTKPLDVGKSIEEKFLIREQTLWERKVEELRNEREMEFAPVYDTYDASRSSRTEEDNEELGEEDDAIVNFISFVRQNT